MSIWQSARASNAATSDRMASAGDPPAMKSLLVLAIAACLLGVPVALAEPDPTTPCRPSCLVELPLPEPDPGTNPCRPSCVDIARGVV